MQNSFLKKSNNDIMLKVGLTGGIGSGKTTIATAFAKLGVRIYNCDLAAHKLTDTNKTIVDNLKKAFGSNIYNPDNTLNRKALANIIFSDKAKLEFVNSLVHPIVAEDFKQWCEERKSEGHKWVLCESAVMVESGMDKLMDKLIVVSLPAELRIKRAMERDHASREQIENRVRNQGDMSLIESKANYIIRPDDKHLIIPQLIDINNRLNETAIK